MKKSDIFALAAIGPCIAFTLIEFDRTISQAFSAQYLVYFCLYWVEKRKEDKEDKE